MSIWPWPCVRADIRRFRSGPACPPQSCLLGYSILPSAAHAPSVQRVSPSHCLCGVSVCVWGGIHVYTMRLQRILLFVTHPSDSQLMCVDKSDKSKETTNPQTQFSELVDYLQILRTVCQAFALYFSHSFHCLPCCEPVTQLVVEKATRDYLLFTATGNGTAAL